ncbi:MAG TPA: hypothetical protein PKY77_03115 [Phycisphaerae bacterium]|nr:hypothetical protein [Phycisphaerae bacterium]HRY67411.1 hypothetical protein [Phycisphaerae bacterium]HSA28998.1 hypothetical protein [Phycisphaerae bacterium]
MRSAAYALMIALVAVFLVTPAAAEEKRGGESTGLGLHPDNPRYFLFRGKPTILITSGEHYGAVLNLDFDYLAYLDELQSKGLNLTRTFSGTYREIPGSFRITDNTLAPQRYQAPWPRTSTPGASDGGKFDLKRFDDAYFARLKDFLAQAGKRGIVVEYVLFCPFYEEDLWKVNPMNAANNTHQIGRCPREEVYTLRHEDLQEIQEALTRKAVTELNAFDNVYFEICNEPYFGGVTLEWQARIAQVIAETERALPNKHLIAQNIANGRRKVEKPDPRVSILNFHYAQPPDTVGMNYGLDRVVGDDETGFRGKADALYRTEGWDFVLAGGGIYSSLDYSFTPKHPAGTLRDYQSPGGGSPELRAQLGILRKFMEGFDFVRMRPGNEVIKGGSVTASLGGARDEARTARVTVRVLAEEGKAYAVYILGGTQAELVLELPPGTYQAEWLNTRTGRTDKAERIPHDGGRRSLTSPPYTEDIALAVKRVAGP